MAVTYGTTDRLTGGTASATEGTGTAASAVDDNSSTYWQSTTANQASWIYDFGSNLWKISKIGITGYNSWNLNAFEIYVTSDGGSDVLKYSGNLTDNETEQYFTFTNNGMIRYVKLKVISGTGAQTNIRELEAFEGIYPPSGAFMFFL